MILAKAEDTSWNKLPFEDKHHRDLFFLACLPNFVLLLALSAPLLTWLNDMQMKYA